MDTVSLHTVKGENSTMISVLGYAVPSDFLHFKT